MSMPNIDEDDVTFEDIATLCEESQDELADLFLQEVPFYSFIKTEPVDFDTPTDAQVPNFLHCDAEAPITDIAHEETCCSNDCYNSEVRSPESERSFSHLSPANRKKSSSSRKNRTPNTLRHIMEKHRHSERIRHHSLNEQLKVICQLVPGSAEDSRETKDNEKRLQGICYQVVMMQRVISYIAFLENSIKFLCMQLGSEPHPNWVLLTTSFRDYFKDYFKGFEDDEFDDEVLAATSNLTQSMKEDDNSYGQLKVSSPTVGSTSDSVVPVMEKEVTVLSQDSGGLSSNLAGDKDHHMTHVWTVCGEHVLRDNESHDAEEFFSSSVDDGVSAVLEISSSTQVNSITAELEYEDSNTDTSDDNPENVTVNSQPFVTTLQSVSQRNTPFSTVHGYYTIENHVPAELDSKCMARRNKRKQLSPRRSSLQDDDYLSGRAYLPSWSSEKIKSVPLQSDDSQRSPCKVRVLPYNMRCNHRHPVQRLQATRSKLTMEYPALVQVSVPQQEDPASAAAKESQDKLSSKLDLRKTSWMNGFMMFSRLNRRKFIQAHPGVHTSHISKIMGHTWRNMQKEEQAPYKEKAKKCAQELYKAYTTQPEFTVYSPVSSAAATPTTTTTTTTIATNATPPMSLVKMEPNLD